MRKVSHLFYLTFSDVDDSFDLFIEDFFVDRSPPKTLEEFC